jgi:hypothetical protein
LIVVSKNHFLGLIDGFTIVSPVRQQLGATVGTGVLALDKGGVVLGSNVHIDGFAYSVAARDHSFWAGNPGLRLTRAADVAGWAYGGSMFVCDGVIIEDVHDVAEGLGFGLQPEYNSTGISTGFDVTGCFIAGIASLSGSLMRAFAGVSHDNPGSGGLARDKGNIEAHGSSFIDNGRYGLEYIGDGGVTGNDMVVTGNTLGNYAARAVFENGDLGGRIAFYDGAGRIDVAAALPLYVNTAGGTQFEVRHAASAVNYPYVKGASSAAPAEIGSAGTGTNKDLLIKPASGGVLRWGTHQAGAVTPNGKLVWKTEDGVQIEVPAYRP